MTKRAVKETPVPEGFFRTNDRERDSYTRNFAPGDVVFNVYNDAVRIEAIAPVGDMVGARVTYLSGKYADCVGVVGAGDMMTETQAEFNARVASGAWVSGEYPLPRKFGEFAIGDVQGVCKPLGWRVK